MTCRRKPVLRATKATMMKRNLLVLSLLTSAALLSLGCGDEEEAERQPAIAARVGNVTITQAAVIRIVTEEWPMGEPYGGAKVKPPHYTACVEAKNPITRAQRALAREHCRRTYFAHERFAMSRLIQLAWARLAAKAHGVEPTHAEVRRLFDRQMRSFDATAAQKIRSSQRWRRSFLANVRTVERSNRLDKVLDGGKGRLEDTLARRYAATTTCAKQYRGELGVPECSGG